MKKLEIRSLVGCTFYHITMKKNHGLSVVLFLFASLFMKIFDLSQIFIK